MSFTVAAAPPFESTVLFVTLNTRAFSFPTLKVFAFWSTAAMRPRNGSGRVGAGCVDGLGEGEGVVFGDGEGFAFGEGVTLGLGARVGDFLMAPDAAAQAIAAKQAIKRRNLFFISGVD